MEKENNKVKTLFADKSSLWRASSNSLLLMPYVIIWLSENLSTDVGFLWLFQICIMSFLSLRSIKF